MNTIDNNRPSQSISFGIAFKNYTRPDGVKTGDLIDIWQEIKMYKKINKSLKKDTFQLIDNGLSSEKFTIQKDTNYPNSLIYTDKTGKYFMTEDKMNLNNAMTKFKKVRTLLDKVISSKETK